MAEACDVLLQTLHQIGPSLRVDRIDHEANHSAFQELKQLRTAKIRLHEDLTPQHVQLHQRKGLSTDFQHLKARGYKPFFMAASLKHRIGSNHLHVAKGRANKVLTAAAQAARAATLLGNCDLRTFCSICDSAPVWGRHSLGVIESVDIYGDTSL